MFTGIVTDVGRLAARDGGVLQIETSYAPDGIALGASIACDGCCLTVTHVERRASGSTFTVEASHETFAKTTLGEWQPGQAINLERALAMGDELGGHLVTGHVDGIARIVERHPDGTSQRFLFAVAPDLAKFIAPKGSVALAGTSLTVNEVNGDTFGVNLIPHTLEHTTWGRLNEGDAVNLEIDLLARYVARLHEAQPRSEN